MTRIILTQQSDCTNTSKNLKIETTTSVLTRVREINEKINNEQLATRNESSQAQKIHHTALSKNINGIKLKRKNKCTQTSTLKVKSPYLSLLPKKNDAEIIKNIKTSICDKYEKIILNPIQAKNLPSNVITALQTQLKIHLVEIINQKTNRDNNNLTLIAKTLDNCCNILLKRNISQIETHDEALTLFNFFISIYSLPEKLDSIFKDAIEKNVMPKKETVQFKQREFADAQYFLRITDKLFEVLSHFDEISMLKQRNKILKEILAE